MSRSRRLVVVETWFRRNDVRPVDVQVVFAGRRRPAAPQELQAEALPEPVTTTKLVRYADPRAARRRRWAAIVCGALGTASAALGVVGWLLERL